MSILGWALNKVSGEVNIIAYKPAKYKNTSVFLGYMKLTAIIKKGEKQYVALCPEVDVASQGPTVEEALANLREAVELHCEVIDS